MSDLQGTELALVAVDVLINCGLLLLVKFADELFKSQYIDWFFLAREHRALLLITGAKFTQLLVRFILQLNRS